MTKTPGFKIRIDAFLPIDRKNFAAQAEAYSLVAEMQKSGKIPDDLLAKVKNVSVDVKQGSAEIEPDAPATGTTTTTTQPSLAELFRTDPAAIPLGTDPLPEGATVLETADTLDETVLQLVKLADGTETARRISADQDHAEVAAKAGGKKK